MNGIQANEIFGDTVGRYLWGGRLGVGGSKRRRMEICQAIGILFSSPDNFCSWELKRIDF